MTDTARTATSATGQREFPTAVVASLSTGILICGFSAMHECAEYLMGHPIWTHHFANKELWRAMQRAIVAQCPGMPTELRGVTKDNYTARVAELEAQLGPTQTLRKGDGKTAMSPMDGIPAHITPIVVEV